MASVLPLLFPERDSLMTHVFVAVLLLVSGVYYPITVLPGPLQSLAQFSPAYYVLDGSRKAARRGADHAALALHLAGAADGAGTDPARVVGFQADRGVRQAHGPAAPERVGIN